MRVIIATGTGKYADPWHPFEETSQRLAGFLGQDRRINIEVDTDVDHAMSRAASFDLVIVDAGDPWRTDGRARDAVLLDHPPAAAVQGMADAVESGTGFLALHAAVATLRDYPQWAQLTGALWLPTVSWHPPKSALTVTPADSSSADGPVSVPSPFQVTDELYLQMQPVGDREVVAESRYRDAGHPVAWIRTVGPSRAAVDVLGHGPESYDSDGHRQLVTSLAWWAARPVG